MQVTPHKRKGIMPKSNPKLPIISKCTHVMEKVYLPRILSCLEMLSPVQIWWRPNEASNSVGNLALHLAGNVRQWIVSGLGGAEDKRQRDLEFSERGPLPRRIVACRLRKAVAEACRALRKLTPQDLERIYTIQKFQVTGFEAAFHVAEHFSHHAGQIILITKMLTSRDLEFTHLPDEKKRERRKLPAL